ncbi:WD repeat-containing protein 36-like [Homarus americanus]|uniref:WD repeat-containing protein 36-like n=1 Tax=Homarus americanus TaxID=6706 RepID=A0A8J5JYJ6_HOMAM|nr:WD repeat-containing protein 36-like [Homarus americanus]KAG7161754.1 WD repeat-containing protein 36-like [Homarus americanus]
MAEGSKIFTSYRALGLVSTHVPLVVRYIQRRKENLIVTVVGNTFHTYGAGKLRLLSVGNPHDTLINSMTGDAYHVYTSSNNIIYAWRRGTELKHKYVGHEASVHLMLPFGPHLIAVDRLNNLRVWDIKVESLYMEMEFQAKSFEISAIMHPATYLNKILVGSKQGKLQLWNIKTCKLVYTFSGWNSSVCVLEQAPAQDVIAVGLANGRIILHNLKFDETVVDFKQDWGRVTGISFRTDGFPVMVTGSEIGHIALWDLKERRLVTQVRDAHAGLVSGISCLPSEPLMVTSSPDNTLKMWIFDLPDGGARLLKRREGHSAPPLLARFHGSLGNSILTAGEDSTMRVFSTVTDIMNKSLGQASYNRKASKRQRKVIDTKKMSAIMHFTSEVAQERAWDNVVAIHRGNAFVTTWSIGSQKMGKYKLIHERFKDKELHGTVATCLELTVCGNFVVIGYNSGHLDKYNIQSGVHRGTFGSPVAHEGGVRGVVTDGLNHCVVSGGQDGELRWWRMKDYCIIKKLIMDEGISKMSLNRDSGLLGIALEDWSIHIVDVDTKNLVRKLYGHHNQVTDIAFSPDSKWLISSSLDKAIRTWDIPSGTCVDWFLVPIPATSLTMSPVGDFLATTHTDHLGIYLWSNQACYHHISLRPLPENFMATVIALPSTGADETQLVLKEGEEIPEPKLEETIDDDEYKSPQQISEEFVTLALLPTSRWLNLLSLDVIKKRNKPVEPPKVPKSAPFFLPTVPGLEFKFASAEQEKSDEKSKVKSVLSFEVLTPFGKKLKAGDLEDALKMLLEMGSSGVEVEIRGLDPDIGGSEAVLVKFLEMIKFALDKNCYFEAVQGYLGLFLKIHAEFIMKNSVVYEMCEKLAVAQEKSWHDIRDTMNQSLCLVSYIKNAALINY